MKLSVGIPTYRREQVLIDTLMALLDLPSPADEILVVDQTPVHDPATVEALKKLSEQGRIRWITQATPSIPMAMNRILLEASGDRMLFLDDDIVPGKSLSRSHRDVGAAANIIVAGQVLQLGEGPAPLIAGEAFRFSSTESATVGEFMGGNFSIDRGFALAIGGFDENFEGAAYRFEKEMAERAMGAGGSILFEPAASIRHLRAPSGGTRARGSHLTSASPAHSVGEYYFLLGSRRVQRRWRAIIGRMARSVATRHHLGRPWWIPVTLVAELRGLVRAAALHRHGPRLLGAR